MEVWGIRCLRIVAGIIFTHQVGAKSNPSSKTFYVPSVCHCQELCIANIGIGCKSYVYDEEKYLQGKGNCVLQTNLFEVQKSSPAGSFEFLTSGTPQLRVGLFDPGRIVKDSPYLTGFSFDAAPVRRAVSWRSVAPLPITLSCSRFRFPSKRRFRHSPV